LIFKILFEGITLFQALQVGRPKIILILAISKTFLNYFSIHALKHINSAILNRKNKKKALTSVFGKSFLKINAKL